MIAINGIKTTIAGELLGLLPLHEAQHAKDYRLPGPPPEGCDRFVFCQGYLAGLPATLHDEETASRTFQANFLQVASAIDAIMATNERARVVVIGSESGAQGSFDTAYAAAKAGLHLFCERKRLKPNQQLVCVAPAVIEDSGMTRRRGEEGAASLEFRRREHPKQRLLSAAEVARLVHFLLYEDQGYLSGTVIRMHGGGR